MENVFDALCAVLSEPENKQAFLDEEGGEPRILRYRLSSVLAKIDADGQVELMVLIMKEKKVARSRSIKVLDYAMSGSAGTPNCERFVDALGLKTLFAAFMNKACTHLFRGSQAN
jgi:beta-catenin-like protein 1